MNLPIIFRFFSLIFRFELFCVRAKSTDNRPIFPLESSDWRFVKESSSETRRIVKQGGV